MRRLCEKYGGHAYPTGRAGSPKRSHHSFTSRNEDFSFSAPGGDLQTLIDGDLVPLEGDVVHFVRQLVEGLAYLHERNIAHLDIKVSSRPIKGRCELVTLLVYQDPGTDSADLPRRRQKFPTIFSGLRVR